MPSYLELEAQEKKLRNLLAETGRFTGRRAGGMDLETRRARDAQRKSAALRQEKALFIPKPKYPKRRRQLEADPFEWLRFYLSHVFTVPFQDHHREMIQAIENAMVYAGDQAIAAPRGEGKTTVAECEVIRNVFIGKVNFVVLFAATANDAKNSLGSIKEFISKSDRLLEDYPEICVPVRDVDDTPNRAHSVVVYGDDFPLTNARFQWSGEEITMPRVPGSACAGAIIATRGLDAAVRGLKKGSIRPQLALIDDPDTEDTARSEAMAKKLSDRIERAIAGLAPQGKRMSRVMLTTIQNQECVSSQFTNRQIKPSWKGKRFAFLKRMPDRQDLWDEYMVYRQAALQEGDEFARKSHNFYLENRVLMDRGAECANPFSFDGRLLEDGSQLQVSPIQRFYDFASDNGMSAAMSELQNDPPLEEGVIESGITAKRIQMQVSGYKRRLIPPGCKFITQGIDVRKVALHWVVRAWRDDATGFTIDYGVQEVWGTTPGDDEGVEAAIIRALEARRIEMAENPYETLDGAKCEIDMTVIDAGWMSDAIYHFVKTNPLKFRAAKGFGKSAGCVQTSFTQPVRNTADKKAGEHWFMARQPRQQWLLCMDADYWKTWEHCRWMTPINQPGTLFLFGEPSSNPDRMSQDQKWHMAYAKHLTNEIEVEEIVDGRLTRKWKSKSDNNHFFDASYMSDVAASMLGVRLLTTSAAAVAQAAPMEASAWFKK